MPEASKRKWPVILGVLFIAGFIAAMVLTSGSGNDKFRVEVCKTFDGRTACFTAASATQMDAERVASDGACSRITSGMTNLEQCKNSVGKTTWK